MMAEVQIVTRAQDLGHTERDNNGGLHEDEACSLDGKPSFESDQSIGKNTKSETQTVGKPSLFCFFRKRSTDTIQKKRRDYCDVKPSINDCFYEEKDPSFKGWYDIPVVSHGVMTYGVEKQSSVAKAQASLTLKEAVRRYRHCDIL
jgi:hypothetical protein